MTFSKAILLSATGVIVIGWMSLYTLKISGVEIRDSVREIITYLSFGLFLCLPLIAAKYYAIPSGMLILIAIILAIIYYMTIIYRDPQLKQGLFGFIGNIMQK